MYQYFILESTKSITSEKDALIALFSELVNIDTIEYKNNQMLIVFQNLLESSLEELAQTINQEFFIEVRLYESKRFKSINELHANIKKVTKMLEAIPFNLNKVYLNFVDLLFFESSKPIDESFKKTILQKYYNDHEIKNILKVFFECNQNISEAAKRLYIHRNTLIQKLDRFYEDTGFNPKRFKDAMLIYQAIEN